MAKAKKTTVRQRMKRTHGLREGSGMVVPNPAQPEQRGVLLRKARRIRG